MSAPEARNNGEPIIIDGDLTFARVQELRERILRETGDDSAACHIELGAIDAIDPAGLQLLLLMRRGWSGCPDGVHMSGAALERFDRMAAFLGLDEWTRGAGSGMGPATDPDTTANRGTYE